MPDSYAIDAISALQGFLARRPHYRPTRQFLGGANNRVLAGDWQGRPVVFKFYGDEAGGHIGPPADRQEREARLLRLWASSGLLPELVECDRRHRISVLGRHHGRSPDWLRGVDWQQAGRGFGRLWAQLAARPLPAAELKAFQVVCCDGRGPVELVDEVLARGAWLLAREPASAFLHDSLQGCRAAAEVLRAGPSMPVRIDNNPGNWLQVAGIVQRLVDVEQSLVGNRTLLEGVLLDREAHGLPGALRGYEELAGAVDLGRTLLAADLQNWLRVLWDHYAWRQVHGATAAGALGSAWQRKLEGRLLADRQLLQRLQEKR